MHYFAQVYEVTEKKTGVVYACKEMNKVRLYVVVADAQSNCGVE